jgi:hypothetical protein
MQAITKNSEQPNSERRRKPRSQHVRHGYNLAWWLVVIGVGAALQELPRLLADKPLPPAPALATVHENRPGKGAATEKEAFIALAFSRVSTTHHLAIPAAAFEAQLTSLKQADYASVRLEQVNRWRQTGGAPLPAKPVLLTFEEANRETMEIADKMLATLGMTALVFVDVNQLNQGNIQLVSWHQLEQLANSGRWEVGVSGCPNGDDEALASPALLAQKLAQQRETLEQRLHVAVVTADCSLTGNPDHGISVADWTQALDSAALQVGFVAAPLGANYRNEPESSFRRIRVSRTWDERVLLAQLESHAPRRTAFVDHFQTDQPDPAWVVDSGDIAIEDGGLRMANKTGEQGALMILGGTEKWQDADVEVQLKGRPEGQFWLYLRHGTGQPFVRLGVSEGRVMLQKSDGIGMTKLLASRDYPLGNPTLRLRVVGSRATAYLNGQALLIRPTEMPEGIDQGVFALAAWNESADMGAARSGDVSVHLAQVSATPLFLKGAIVTPTVGAATWSQLRQQAEALSMISPRYFAWTGGKPQDSGVRDTTIDIFTHYNHLKLLPALAIDEDTPLSDTAALTEQALIWALDPAYGGLNIILKSPADKAKWQSFLNDLNNRMGKAGKILAVTLLDNDAQAAPITASSELLLVTASAELLPATPQLLYPPSKEPTP